MPSMATDSEWESECILSIELRVCCVSVGERALRASIQPSLPEAYGSWLDGAGVWEREDNHKILWTHGFPYLAKVCH